MKTTTRERKNAVQEAAEFSFSFGGLRYANKNELVSRATSRLRSPRWSRRKRRLHRRESMEGDGLPRRYRCR